jgi:hypothetical protein
MNKPVSRLLLIAVVLVVAVSFASAGPDPQRKLEVVFAERTTASWAADLDATSFAEFDALSAEADAQREQRERRERGDKGATYDADQFNELMDRMSAFHKRWEAAAFALAMIGPPQSFVAVPGLVRKLRFADATHAHAALVAIGATLPLYEERDGQPPVLDLPTGVAVPDLYGELRNALSRGTHAQKIHAAEVLTDIAIGRSRAPANIAATQELLRPLATVVEVEMCLDRLAKAAASR